MHASVHDFFAKYTAPKLFTGKKILEVGSLYVNGSVRAFVEGFTPESYHGIDFVDGKGVDEVLDAEDLAPRFGSDSFDTVISTEMLEHAEHWRECVNAMKDVTKTHLIITTRGPGFKRHSHPSDYWRYTVEDMEKIFADFDIIQLMNDTDPNSPGVFFIGKKTKRKRVELSDIELTPAPQY